MEDICSIKGYPITGGSVVLDRKVVRDFLYEELGEVEVLMLFLKKHL